jgi:DNA replication protein DnaC
MNNNIKEALKYLRLSGLLDNWDRHLKTAQKEEYSYYRFLKQIVEEEYNIKKENSRKMRLRRSKIPHQLVIETFPFEKQLKLNKKRITAIYDSGEYMEKHQNIVWIGPTGIGKSGLATSFLINAINLGYSGLFIPFPDLIEKLYKSLADNSEGALIKKLSSYDCLLIDELGYIVMEAAQVGLFFTLMSKRHGKKTTLITTNLGFSQWTTFLNNNHLTAALIDRLTENSHIINMKKCSSLRPKLIQK